MNFARTLERSLNFFLFYGSSIHFYIVSDHSHLIMYSSRTSNRIKIFVERILWYFWVSSDDASPEYIKETVLITSTPCDLAFLDQLLSDPKACKHRKSSKPPFK